MTAFAISSGGVEYYDQKTGGSVNATLDTYTISAGSTLVVRTDSYACLNHSVAFGSIDNIAYSGVGGECIIDPTYTRHVAYTGGSGNSPAFGAAISQGGVSGVFLGAWADWQSEPIVPGAAIPATGFIKIGGVTGGAFAAGALTGIAATCSGADVQSWIEVRSAETATITVPRVGKFSTVEAWFEIGVTSGSRGQVIPCPTTATNAGVFPGVWIESAAGSGVYNRFIGVGSQVPLAETRTDASCSFVWSTTSGIRIGSDGTNNVGYLPPTGCKVRIPAVILTNVLRSGSGSGPRVLPNTTLATRSEFVTTAAGSIDLRGVICQWYVNLSQAYSVNIKSSAVSDSVQLSEVPTQITINDCIVTPTQTLANRSLQITACFAGGIIENSSFWRFSLTAAGSYNGYIEYASGIAFSSVIFGSLTRRTNIASAVIFGNLTSGVTYNNCTIIGGRGLITSATDGDYINTTYYDHTLTTQTLSTDSQAIFEISQGCINSFVSGVSLPIPSVGPYSALIAVTGSYDTVIQDIGSYASPIVLDAAVTGVVLATATNNYSGNNARLKLRRAYASNTRVGLYSLNNADTNVIIENCYGDYSDASGVAALNSFVKACGLAGTTTGQTATYGSHWQDRFTSTTAGVLEVTCNEPTAISAAQCAITSGSPKFNASGSVLMTVVGQQIILELPYFALGHTALANSALTLTGTNTSNLSYEFQYDIGTGYNGTWLTANATNFTGVGAINPALGIKIKLRVTCTTASASNVLTNIRITTVTTSSAQSTNFYPLSLGTVQINGLVSGSRVKASAVIGGAVLFSGAESGGSVSFTTDYTGAIAIEARKASAAPFYIPWNSQLTPVTDGTVSVTALQQLDE